MNDITYLDHQLTYNYFNKKGEIYRLSTDSRMGMYLRAYVRKYFQQPSGIDFLIHAFDRDEEIDFVRDTYSEPLRILAKYKNKLKIYATDSLTAIFYKQIKPSRIVGLSEETKHYELSGNILSVPNMYSYFDLEGYVVTMEELTKKYRRELADIHKKYKEVGWKEDTEGEYTNMVLEYIPKHSVLYNAISKELIPINNSAFYQDIIEWMEKICKENDYSRFIVPSLIPIEKRE